MEKDIQADEISDSCTLVPSYVMLRVDGGYLSKDYLSSYHECPITICYTITFTLHRMAVI